MSEAVVVTENGQGRYQQSIFAGKHHLRSGEPEYVGGDDAGPAPFELLLGALGSCTSMTLRMYAERKGLQLTQISVRLERDTAESEGRTVNRISRHISLGGELSPEQRARLLEIAQKCPMHRALAPAFVLECHLAD